MINKLALLKKWERDINAMDTSINAMIKLTGANPESPLIDSAYCCMQSYTESLSMMLSDDEECLNYYWIECDMGRNPLTVTLGESGSKDAEVVKMDCVENLLKVMEWSNGR